MGPGFLGSRCRKLVNQNPVKDWLIDYTNFSNQKPQEPYLQSSSIKLHQCGGLIQLHPFPQCLIPVTMNNDLGFRNEQNKTLTR